MDIILNSLLVTFLSLMLLTLAIAIAVGYIINKASDLGGPGFLQQDLRRAYTSAEQMAAESATELGAEDLPADRSSVGNSESSSGFSSKSRQDGLQGPGTPSLTRSPCRFCAWLRARAGRT